MSESLSLGPNSKLLAFKVKYRKADDPEAGFESWDYRLGWRGKIFEAFEKLALHPGDKMSLTLAGTSEHYEVEAIPDPEGP